MPVYRVHKFVKTRRNMANSRASSAETHVDTVMGDASGLTSQRSSPSASERSNSPEQDRDQDLPPANDHLLSCLNKDQLHRLIRQAAVYLRDRLEDETAAVTENTPATSAFTSRAVSPAPVGPNKPIGNFEILRLLERLSPDPYGGGSRKRARTSSPSPSTMSEDTNVEDSPPTFQYLTAKPFFTTGRIRTLPNGTTLDQTTMIKMHMRLPSGLPKTHRLVYPKDFSWDDKKSIDKLNKSANQVWYRNMGKAQEKRVRWTEEEKLFVEAELRRERGVEVRVIAEQLRAEWERRNKGKKREGGAEEGVGRRSSKAIQYLLSNDNRFRRLRGLSVLKGGEKRRGQGDAEEAAAEEGAAEEGDDKEGEERGDEIDRDEEGDREEQREDDEMEGGEEEI